MNFFVIPDITLNIYVYGFKPNGDIRPANKHAKMLLLKAVSGILLLYLIMQQEPRLSDLYIPAILQLKTLNLHMFRKEVILLYLQELRIH